MVEKKQLVKWYFNVGAVSLIQERDDDETTLWRKVSEWNEKVQLEESEKLLYLFQCGLWLKSSLQCQELYHLFPLS